AAQTGAAAELWRVAATTLTTPEALATGGASSIWNPAQRPPAGTASLSLEVVQSPSAVGAGGARAVARVRVRPLGVLGAVYGNMRIQDLVHTTMDPTTDGSGIPYGTQLLGFNWTLTHRGTTVGATVGWEHARLNEDKSDETTFDVGL